MKLEWSGSLARTLVALVSATALAAPLAWFVLNPSIPPAAPSPSPEKRETDLIKGKVIRELEPLARMASPAHGRMPIPPELLRQATLLPQTAQFARKNLRVLSEYATTCNTQESFSEIPAELGKTLLWHRFLCGQLSSLPESFFSAPPYVHPAGHSFVARAVWSGRAEFQGRDFLKKHRAYIHARELASFGLRPEPPLAWFLSLEPLESDLFLAGEKLVVGKDFVLAESPDDAAQLSVFTRSAWDEELRSQGWETTPTPSWELCPEREGNACWSPLPVAPPRQMGRAVTAATIFAAALALALLTLYLMERRRVLKEREFILRALTHELRTPVTSLRLAAETLREGFEALDANTQRAALVVLDETERLNRIIRASVSYLSVRRPAPGADLRTLPSVNEFVEETVEKWLDSLEIQPLDGDGSLVTDPYWLSVCLQNLVSNAMAHGRPPVKLVTHRQGRHVVFSVSDGGNLDKYTLRNLFKPFRKAENSTGLGLGLSIVRRKARDLGGRLEVSPAPTTFRLWVRDLS